LSPLCPGNFLLKLHVFGHGKTTVLECFALEVWQIIEEAIIVVKHDWRILNNKPLRRHVIWSKDLVAGIKYTDYAD
jgi:hypothetical protein